MKKRIGAFVLSALIAVFALMPCVSAASISNEAEMYKVLSAMGVMTGDENGNLNLGATVKRSEFVKMLTCASVYKDLAKANANVSPFSDVRSTHWAAGYVKTAIDEGWVNGYLDGTFRPDNGVLLEEAVTMTLKMLGYTDEDFKGAYPSGQLALYKSLELNDNITATKGQPLTRKSCAQLIYNALSADTKDGKVYATTLGYEIDASGKVNFVSIYNSAMTGPVIASAMGVEYDVGFVPQTIYKNGIETTASHIVPYDVLYVIEDTKSVYAYNDRITGMIEAITTRSSPTVVTVSGKNYDIGTSSASLALSNMGSFDIGDSVTLLLGNDGSVVSVVEAGKIDNTIYGLVIKSGQKAISDGVGGTYDSGYIEVYTTSGATYEYACTAKYYSVGNIVEISTDSGELTIEKIFKKNTDSWSAKVDSKGSKLGEYKFADDAEILDVRDGQAAIITPLRLANVKVNDIILRKLNAAGEIETLILDDVTGDASTYALLTSAVRTDNEGSGSSTYRYTLIVDGVSQIVTSGRSYEVSSGPVVIRYGDDGSIFDIDALQSAYVSRIGDGTVTADKETQILSSNVMVFEKTKDGHMSSTVNKISDLDKYNVTAYFDKPSSEGGRVRALIATEKIQ